MPNNFKMPPFCNVVNCGCAIFVFYSAFILDNSALHLMGNCAHIMWILKGFVRKDDCVLKKIKPLVSFIVWDFYIICCSNTQHMPSQVPSVTFPPALSATPSLLGRTSASRGLKRWRFKSWLSKFPQPQKQWMSEMMVMTEIMTNIFPILYNNHTWPELEMYLTKFLTFPYFPY